MGKRTGPRHGSKAFYPRGKAKRQYVTINSYPESSKAKLLGFPAYKAGMTRAIATETYEHSPKYGKEVAIPVTILEAPPVYVFAVRLYEKTAEGLKALTEIYAEKLPKELGRKIILPKKYDSKKELEEAEKLIEKTAEIRAVVCTQPKKIKLKKTPEIIEIKIGGAIEEAWNYAKEKLGKEVQAKEVFEEEGKMLDIAGVTKGKGTQGPVKRFGIKVQRRKAHGHRRHPGAIGAWHPARVLWTAPMAGQMGYQRRTELNKQLLKIGEDGKEVTPKGGFTNYGEVNSPYIMIKGSIPGPKKRLVMTREAIRKQKEKPLPAIKEIITQSQQG